MGKAVMALHDDFDDRQQLVEYLARQLLFGRLAVVLGAGISRPFGLPDWNELVEGLFATRSESPPNGSPERQAEYYRLKYCSSDPKQLVDAIHDVLYSKVSADFASLRKNGTLAAIGSLVMASHRGSASEVLTFNFDNLLELYLAYHGFVTAPVFRESHWTQTADVTIYHPHGFIPFDADEEGSNGNEVVLDQSSYSAVVGKAENPWRQTALTILRRRTCLFIGLSGKDDNLDSMMMESREQHASRDENTLYWGITFSTSDDDCARRIWQERGVYYCKIEDYENDLPGFLFSICQNAATLRKHKYS